jgi:molybdate transport system substrate-binding protein
VKVRRTALLLVAALVALLTGCGSSSGSSGSSTAPASITVYAAASLKSTFTTLGTQFEQANPNTRVTFSFAGSSDLVTQITSGAPADVFASADEKNMAKLTDAKLVTGTPADFATNTLTIVVPPNNPAQVKSFADLARSGTQVVVCAPQVPCGSAATKVEQLTGTTLKPVSEESSVTDVLAKVTSGEADAGLVYVTDAKTVGPSVTAVSFPESDKAVNTYPIAPVTTSKQPQLARRFADYVTGPAGQQVLRDAGFGAP